MNPRPPASGRRTARTSHRPMRCSRPRQYPPVIRAPLPRTHVAMWAARPSSTWNKNTIGCEGRPVINHAPAYLRRESASSIEEALIASISSGRYQRQWARPVTTADYNPCVYGVLETATTLTPHVVSPPEVRRDPNIRGIDLAACAFAHAGISSTSRRYERRAVGPHLHMSPYRTVRPYVVYRGTGGRPPYSLASNRPRPQEF